MMQAHHTDKTASNSAPTAFRTSAICAGVKYPGIAARSSLEQLGIGSLDHPPHPCSKMRLSPVWLATSHVAPQVMEGNDPHPRVVGCRNG
jgi:hypothetical protein